MELPKNIIQKPMYSTDKNLTDGRFFSYKLLSSLGLAFDSPSTSWTIYALTIY